MVSERGSSETDFKGSKDAWIVKKKERSVSLGMFWVNRERRVARGSRVGGGSLEGKPVQKERQRCQKDGWVEFPGQEVEER